MFWVLALKLGWGRMVEIWFYNREVVCSPPTMPVLKLQKPVRGAHLPRLDEDWHTAINKKMIVKMNPYD